MRLVLLVESFTVLLIIGAIVFLVIKHPDNKLISTIESRNIKEHKTKVPNISEYNIQKTEKHPMELVWPDSEFPERIYVKKGETNLIGTYRLEKAEYVIEEEK